MMTSLYAFWSWSVYTNFPAVLAKNKACQVPSFWGQWLPGPLTKGCSSRCRQGIYAQSKSHSEDSKRQIVWQYQDYQWKTFCRSSTPLHLTRNWPRPTVGQGRKHFWVKDGLLRRNHSNFTWTYSTDLGPFRTFKDYYHFTLEHHCDNTMVYENRGQKPSHTHTWMQILNPSTSTKPIMTKLQNLFVALVSINIFQMTLKFTLFTVD